MNKILLTALVLVLFACHAKFKHYNEASHFVSSNNEGLIIIKENQKYGVINAKKRLYLPLIYDYLFWNQAAELYTAVIENEIVFVNLKNEIINLADTELDFSEGLAGIL